jgi:hypothetical protein
MITDDSFLFFGGPVATNGSWGMLVPEARFTAGSRSPFRAMVSLFSRALILMSGFQKMGERIAWYLIFQQIM